MGRKRWSLYAVAFLGLLMAAIFVVARINQYDEAHPFIYGELDHSSPTPSLVFSPEPTALATMELAPAAPTPSSTIQMPAPEPELELKPEPELEPEPTRISKIILKVPYISEAPSGNFSGPWKNACEEASITMVEKYYLGATSVSIREAEDFMAMLFNKEDIFYGSNKNTDAAQTAEIINKYSSYHAVIKTDPTIEEIKNELEQNRPVISLHRGFDLQNENIRFAPTLSSYHMMVIIGYDDETRKFITNDPGDLLEGAGRRYDYDLFMASLHDYDQATKKAEGPARVIFTSRF